MNQKITPTFTPTPRKLAKTDVRYWRNRVMQRFYKNGERAVKEVEYTVEVMFRRRRHRFRLETANRDAAAARARDIYLSLQSRGWNETLVEYAPAIAAVVRNVEGDPIPERPTVGDLIREVNEISTARKTTLETYFKALRKIVGDVMGITGDDKFRAKTGGTQKWRTRVEKVKLERLTPDALQKWKVSFLRSAGNDPSAQRRVKTTYNSLVRNARALFSKKQLPHLKARLNLPEPLPLSTLDFEKRQSMRYRSKIKPEQLLEKAQRELGNAPADDEECESKREQFKILLLGLLCGLRKSEIDTLLWDAFDFDARILRVEPNEFNHLKSEDSAGEVDLDQELVDLFLNYQRGATSPFVIESKNLPRNLSEKRSYRAEIHFQRLNQWLRENGVDALKPLHELRKEFGALITQRAGIYAASRALRHSDIAITVAHYADKKDRVTSGLSGLLGKH